MYSLRRREERDLIDLFEIFHQPKCREALSGPDFETPEALSDSLAAFGPNRLELVICRRNSAVGYGGLFLCAGERRHTGWLSLFVHDAHQGLGLGDRLFAALVAAADGLYGLRRLELVVRCDNPRAIEFYRRRGFRIEGRHVEFAMRAGGYVDVFTMSRLNASAPAPARVEADKVLEPTSA